MIGTGFSPKHMVHVEGGVFQQGSEAFYPEERPIHQVTVEGIWLDRHPVTNGEFCRFVVDTGHVTVAERGADTSDLPAAMSGNLAPGSWVFTPTRGPVPLDNPMLWWRWVPGASWRHPEGPGSTLNGRERHPVVHVAHADAMAYADWADKRLATEAEWEHAARGGLDGATYPWGDEYMPRSRAMANTWHGDFPWRVDRPGRYGRTTPVGMFPPNGYGLVDTVGNVWEWTASPWTTSHGREHAVEQVHPCCVPQTTGDQGRIVIKGGSYVCDSARCHCCRPAARQGQVAWSTTSHLGFRCAHTL